MMMMMMMMIAMTCNKKLTSSCCLDYDDQLLHTCIIRAHYTYLLETLDVKFSGLVSQLICRQVIRSDEAEEIRAEQTSFRANEKLLSVLSHKSQQQFQLFLDELDSCGQPHVRSVIDNQRGLSIKITEFTHINNNRTCSDLLVTVNLLSGKDLLKRKVLSLE